MTGSLVDLGITEKALLSVMFHNNLQVFSQPVHKIIQTLQTLREQGLALSETLPTILISCPGLLVDFDPSDWEARKEWFDYNFTKRTFGELLITQPQVLLHGMEDIKEKFKWVFLLAGSRRK